MDNLKNLRSIFNSTNLLASDNSLNENILSTDYHLPGSFKNPLLTASSQETSLTLQEDFSGNILDSELQMEILFNDNFINNAVFTIDETGIFTIDFLFDAGGYKDDKRPLFSLPSDGSGGNQSITLQAESYGDTTVNTITGLEAPYNSYTVSQEPSEYLNPSILPVQGIVTGGSEEGVLLNSELANNPSIRNIGFREVNNPTDAEQTWVIVHGWNDTPDGRFTDLAQEISVANSGDRVLLLDWREAAFNSSESLGIEYGVPGTGNFRAASWISPVAEFAVKALNDYYGIDSLDASQSLNLIGHSLGSLVNAEMGRIYRDGLTVENETVLTGNNEGARTITALDPPSARNRDENPFTVDPIEDVYDIDGRIDGIQTPQKFVDASVFSRAFVGEKSIAGNKHLALTADEAFEMHFGTESEFLTDFGSEHDRVVRAFTNTINQQGLLGDLLGIRAYESLETLPIDDLGEILQEEKGGYKGIIDVNEKNQIISLDISDSEKDLSPNLSPTRREA